MKLLNLPNAPTFNPDRFRPIRITATLASPPALYDAPTLDGVLAWAVVMKSTHGRGLPESPEPTYIPLPLHCLWTCPHTHLPLWDATRFYPVDATDTHTSVYWHKRGYKPHLLQKTKKGTPQNANFGNGRHKEYRMPIPVHAARVWTAYANGDPHAIDSMLRLITGIGKKRTQGYGRINHWHLEHVDTMVYEKDDRLLKSIPTASHVITHWNAEYTLRDTGWTPPYWLATTFQPCFV